MNFLIDVSSKDGSNLSLLSLVFLLLSFHQQMTESKIILNSLRYDADVTARLSETKLEARFQNSGTQESKETLELLIPENALVTSFSTFSKNINYTSVIAKKKRSKTDQPEHFLLHQRTAQAQRLTIDVVLEPEETLELHLGYTELFRRKRGLYHLVLYLPSTEAQNLYLDIGVRVMGEMEDLTFLEANGNEEPLSVIQHGTAEIYSSSRKEAKLQYKRNIFTKSPFTSVTHRNPNLGMIQPDLHLSFKPDDVPNLFLSDPAFVMSYDVARYPDGGGIQIQNGYFVHFISPEGLPKLPVHTVFVLDISGSMDELGKLANLKTAMTTTLHSLKSEDSFEIFVFSTNVNSLGIYTGSTKDIIRSINKINELRAYGGTNINDALIDSLYGANEYKISKGAKQIVFLTDGNRTVGEMDELVIRRNVREANVDLLPIYALAFGDDADMKFLRQVSGENRGFARKIRSEGRPADQLRGFYKEISTPLLTDLDVNYNKNEVEEKSVFKLGQDNFYSGDEVVYAGKMKEGSKTLTPQVIGTGASGRLQLKVSRKETLQAPAKKKSGVLERLWAYLAVQDLLTSQELIDDENISLELRARALEIALKYNFVTKLTSLLISDPSHLRSDEPNNDEGLYSSPLGGFLPSVRNQIAQGLNLVSPEDFAATLPDALQSSIPPSPNRRYSFADNDPHFVVQVPGLALPICFDLHGHPGDVLSLVRDQVSGLIVNAEVSAAIGRPGATYFTKLFISIKRLNLTVTTKTITANCNQGHEENEVSEIWHEPDPFEQLRKLKARRRRTNLRDSRNSNRRKQQSRPSEQVPFHSFLKGIFHKFSRKTRSVSRLRHTNGAQCHFCESNKYSLENSGYIRNRLDPGIDADSEGNSPVIDAYLERDRKKDALLTVGKNLLPKHKSNNFNFSWELMPGNEQYISNKVDNLNQYYNRPFVTDNQSLRNIFTVSSHKKYEPEKPNETFNECDKTLSWHHAARRRYDDVVFTVRGRRRRRRLDIIVGDLDLHVVVTNTRNKQGQEFLGFYIKEQKILSPTTTGVIGQFVYKSVGTIGHFPELATDPKSLEFKSIPLAVVHLPQPGMMQTRVTNVMSTVSKRRSLLHREKVLCLHVRKHGKGLLAKRSKDYLLPDLTS